MGFKKGRKEGTYLDWFMEKVEKVPESGCWIWLGALTKWGYGNFTYIKNGKRSWIGAHRFSYLHFKGLIPPHTELDHLCRVTCCVNPDHLEPVSHRENTRRGYSITAKNSQKTHCKRGHPLVGNNLYIRPNIKWPARNCKTCGKELREKRELKFKMSRVNKLPPISSLPT